MPRDNATNIPHERRNRARREHGTGTRGTGSGVRRPRPHAVSGARPTTVPQPGRVRGWLAVLVLGLLLGACAAPPKEAPDAAEAVERAARLVEDGRPLAAVRIYRDLAAAAEPAERQRWHLRIVELLFDEGYPELALEWHRRLDAEPIPDGLAERKQVVDAQAAVARRQGVRALRLLPEIEPDMPDVLKARILATRADAHDLAGQPRPALAARIERGRLLETPEAIERNHDAIWALLQTVPAERLGQLAELPDAPELRGWAELARAVRNARLGERPVTEALDEWQRRFRDHPAAERFVATLRERVLAELTYPERIALLLPLSGPLADAGAAIRDGLLAAYYNQPDYIQRPEIALYDTGADGLEPGAAYARAVADGAAFVIGPLDKAAVATLADRVELEVPVLSLNYLPEGSVRPPSNLYQFGLLPEDEARQAAEAAIQNNHFNAIALVPDGDWGERMLTAFASRFEELGGVLLGAAQYNSRATDYGRPIQSVLNLDRSYARERMLQSTIGRDVRFEPRRRQDVEVVFLAAMPRQARLLEPQLEFHRAADLPAYATSHVFSGTPDADADWDMNGLFFTEIPWLLDNLRTPDALFREVSTLWPGIHGRYPRLYALGIDAFSVLPHLERLDADAGVGGGLTGRTGRLTLDQRRRIRRQLQWAWFDKGVPIPVSRPEAVDELDVELELDAAVGADVRERTDGP